MIPLGENKTLREYIPQFGQMEYVMVKIIGRGTLLQNLNLFNRNRHIFAIFSLDRCSFLPEIDKARHFGLVLTVIVVFKFKTDLSFIGILAFIVSTVLPLDNNMSLWSNCQCTCFCSCSHSNNEEWNLLVSLFISEWGVFQVSSN